MQVDLTPEEAQFIAETFINVTVNLTYAQSKQRNAVIDGIMGKLRTAAQAEKPETKPA